MVLDFHWSRIRKYLEVRHVGDHHRTERQLGLKASQFLQTYKESGHPIVLGTTIFGHGTLQQNKGK